MQTIIELEQMSTQQLKGLITEVLQYDKMTVEQQYDSGLYKLTSDLIHTYGNHVDIQLVGEAIATEIGKRVGENLLKK